jgi:hypothetical protein
MAIEVGCPFGISLRAEKPLPLELAPCSQHKAMPMPDTKRLSLKNYGSVPWLENPEGNNSPIGSVLEKLNIDSGIGTDAPPVVTIHITLIGKTHDGRIRLTYQRVHEYSVEGFATSDPSGNTWTEDILKLRKTDVLKHKVTLTAGSWTIEADDIEFSWEPL